MPLNHEKQQKVKAWVSQHLKACAVCGGRDWGMDTTIYAMQAVDLEYKMPKQEWEFSSKSMASPLPH